MSDSVRERVKTALSHTLPRQSSLKLALRGKTPGHHFSNKLSRDGAGVHAKFLT